MLTSFRSRPAFYAIVALFAIDACAMVLKLHFIPFTPSSDYAQYVGTARALGGEPGAEVSMQRILKPLAPAVVAVGAPIFGGYENAFLFQMLFFYGAMILAMYLLAYEWCEDHALAVMVTALSALSYPILKYGVDLTTETGAIFFYVISLWLTLRFVREPRRDLFWWNVAAIALGFLWKEYSIVAAIIFGLAILFHASLSVREKAALIAEYAFAFLAVNISWQLYVFEHYNYTYLSWYRSGGAPGFSYEFTIKNLIKSTAALLGLAWLIVPFGIKPARMLEPAKRLFLTIAVPPPFIALLWGFVSSRLFYVIAPPFLLLAALGMKSWKRSAQLAIVVLTIVANIIWLFLSYSIKL